MRNKIFIILVFIFLINLFFRIYSYGSEYMSHFDSVYWEKRYELSQWSPKEACRNLDPHVNPKTCQWDDAWYEANKNADESVLKKTSLGDDGLYTYAGWKYIHGSDPTLLNAEIPPLGKYLIGLSIIVFGNQNIFALLSGLLVLISFFILNKMIFKNRSLALLPVFILSLDPLFYTQLKAPFLDLLYLGFLILTFIYFLKDNFFISMIFLGLTMATKASAATFLLVIISFLTYWLCLRDRSKIIKILLYSPISLATFILTYTVYFLQNHSIIDFLKVQKWVINFYATGTKGDPIAALQIIFTGSWPTWWGEVAKVPEWTILWPASLLITILSTFILIRKSMQNRLILFAIWIVIYLVFLCFIPVFPRYLLLVLPFMYTLSVWIFSKKIRWFS